MATRPGVQQGDHGLTQVFVPGFSLEFSQARA
jgi:hypothetical protein